MHAPREVLPPEHRDTRGGCPSVAAPARSSGSTSSPATSTSTGSIPGRARRLDEILALGDEQAELVAPAPRLQLADELQPLVRRRRDHAAPSRAIRHGSRRGRGTLCAAGPGHEPEAPRALARARIAGRDERERRVGAGVVERGAHALALLECQVAERGGLEDDRQPVRRPPREQPGQQVDQIAADELGRFGTHGRDRPVEQLEPVGLVCPDEAPQEPGAVLARDVDRRAVDPDARAHRRPEAQERGGHLASLGAGELEGRVIGPPGPERVRAAVAIPDQVEAGARPQLDQVERAGPEALGGAQHAREQHPGAPDLVRLDALLGRRTGAGTRRAPAGRRGRRPTRPCPRARGSGGHRAAAAGGPSARPARFRRPAARPRAGGTGRRRAATGRRSAPPAGERPRRGRSGLERGLRLLGDLAERGGIADGEVGEHLAVELDARPCGSPR